MRPLGRFVLAVAALGVVAAVAPAAHADSGPTPTAAAPVTIAKNPRPPALHVLWTRSPGVFAEASFRKSGADMKNLAAAITEISRSVVKPHLVQKREDATITVARQDLPEGVDGATLFCTWTSDHHCRTIRVLLDPTSPASARERLHTVTHEMGHAIGLAHTGQGSLMYAYADASLPVHLSTSDIAEINRMYADVP